MPGAPALSGTAGALIGVLDACLVNGFGSVTLNSLAVSNNVATGTVSAGHGLAMIRGANNASPGVGPVIRIAGATPAALNGDWRLASAPNGTTFTFSTEGIANQIATGTITAKRAPLGFSKAFSGTNKAAYRAASVASTRLYFRVDDTTTTYATVKGYESMSDADTGAGAFPAAARYAIKSTTANSTARSWRACGDHAGFYLFINPNGDVYWDGHAWTDLLPLREGDAYHTLLCANTNSSSWGNSNLHLINVVTGKDMPRGHLQTGGSIQAVFLTHARVGGLGYAGMSDYPSAADNAVYCAPVDVWENAAADRPRGVMPGLYSPLHSGNPPDGTLIDKVPQLSGKALFTQSLVSAYRAAIDILGPWR